MGRPESYAGITVPEGSPDELRTLAGSFSHASAEMLSTATTLGGLPSELGVWQGPASVNFASSSLTASDAARSGAMSFLTASISVRAYADDLEDAQTDVEQAIEDARDATHRIHVAERQIEDARTRAGAAEIAIIAAEAQILAAAVTASPADAAQADLARAQQVLADAQRDERRAQHDLDVAREDLDRAKARAARAIGRAQDAATLASDAVNATAGGGFPQLLPIGGPATPAVGGGGTVGVPPLLPLTKLPATRPQPELGPYRPPGPPPPMPPLFPVDPSLADTLTDTGTLLNYGGALGTGVIQRNNLLTKYFPGAPLKPGGAPVGPGVVSRVLTNPVARGAVRTGGRALPVVGAIVDYGANKASGDSTGRAIRETAVNTVATGIGTAGGGAACGAVTAGTAGVGAAACPFLVIGGTALGAGGGWVANKVIDGIAGVF